MDIALDNDILAVKYNLEEYAYLCEKPKFINLYNRSRPNANTLQSYKENNGKSIYLRMTTPKKIDKVELNEVN